MNHFWRQKCAPFETRAHFGCPHGLSLFYFFRFLLPHSTITLIIPQIKGKFCQWLTISDFEMLPLGVVELPLPDALGEMGGGRIFLLYLFVLNFVANMNLGQDNRDKRVIE